MATWGEYMSTARQRGLPLFGALALALALAPLLLALPARAHPTGTGDLLSAVPVVNEQDITGDATRKGNACGVASATIILDHYLPQSGPVQAALTLDAVSQYVIELDDTSKPKTDNYGTTGQQLLDGLAQASTAADLGVNVPLTDSWHQTDGDHWFAALQAELDAKLPVIVFLDDGSLIDRMNHYGHFIVVSGYTASDDLIVHDPWYVPGDSLTPSKVIPNATFDRVWGATWMHNQSPYFYLELLPPGTASPIPTTTGTSGGSASPPAPTLAYLGQDHNVWLQTIGQGTPHQLTSDAHVNNVTYGGLVWAPDGSLLAVARWSQYDQTLSPGKVELLVLKPDGVQVARVTLDSLVGVPFAWSPDGRDIAYRQDRAVDQTNGDQMGTLVVLDAHTGAQLKSVPYDAGITGCGGLFPALETATFEAHQTYGGLDTFAWAPDQRSILVSYTCSSAGAARVDLNGGAEQVYQFDGASYQPGGNLIVADLRDGSLGTVNAQGQLVTTLVPAPANDSLPSTVGLASWAPDGHSVYFENGSDIWRIGSDGAGARLVVAAPQESNPNAAVLLLPQVSPDGKTLLYLQLVGDNTDNSYFSDAATWTWYLAPADGGQPTELTGATTEAVWQP